MDRTERFYKIDQLLVSGRSVPFATAHGGAWRFARAASSATSTTCASRFNAPIEYSREANGYRYGEPGAGPRFSLPGLWFSPAETYALLTMQHLLETLQPGPAHAACEAAARAPARGARQGRPLRRGSRAAHPRAPAGRAQVEARAFRSRRLGGAQSAPAPDPPLQPPARRGDRAHDLAAAPRPLPRQLVRGRVVPQGRGRAQFCARCRALRGLARPEGEGGSQGRARRAFPVGLRHLRREERAVGEAALHAWSARAGFQARTGTRSRSLSSPTAATCSKCRTRTTASS